MAGEKITIVSGRPTSIRVKAPADAEAGDYHYQGGRGSGNSSFGGVPGFWLHDVKKDEVGDMCIACHIVDMPSNNMAHDAGDIFIGKAAGIEYDFAQNDFRRTPYTIVVYEDTPRAASRILVVWGTF